MTQAPGGRLTSIQVLRAVAAIMVVAHHALLDTTYWHRPPPGSILVPPLWLTYIGAAGVDVFFVISGFLMTYISEPYFAGRKSAGHFLYHRISRIWPPYAIVTLVVAAILLLTYRNPALFDLQPHRLASIFFIPSFNSSGMLHPVLDPGWTLNYEALFYVCFALVLMLGRRRALLHLALILGLLFVLGRLSPPGVAHEFLGDPIIFEFLAGAAIGFAAGSGRLTPKRAWPWFAASALALAAALLAGLDVHTRVVTYGIPAVLLFIGVLALERRAQWSAAALLLGDASYSIYLTHALVVRRITGTDLLMRHGLTEISALAVAVIATLAAIVVGVLFYRTVEVPLLNYTRRLYDRLNPKP